MAPVNGRAVRTGIPANAIIAGTDADHVAGQAAACPVDCPLHVTDVRGGPDTQIALPPHTVIDSGDTSGFDPAGQRLALPLDTTDHQGATVKSAAEGGAGGGAFTYTVLVSCITRDRR